MLAKATGNYCSEMGFLKHMCVPTACRELRVGGLKHRVGRNGLLGGAVTPCTETTKEKHSSACHLLYLRFMCAMSTYTHTRKHTRKLKQTSPKEVTAPPH